MTVQTMIAISGTMQPRLKITAVRPGGLKAMKGPGSYLRQSSVDR